MSRICLKAFGVEYLFSSQKRLSWGADCHSPPTRLGLSGSDAALFYLLEVRTGLTSLA